MSTFAKTPVPPYYAVIFTSVRTPGDNGYGDMADRMLELASQQPGFLGVESARGADGLGITVSYWANEEAIGAWKAHGSTDSRSSRAASSGMRSSSRAWRKSSG